MTDQNHSVEQVTLSQDQLDIITKAADELLASEKTKQEANKTFSAAEKGQLANLKMALSDYPGVVTEATWDSDLKPIVALRLRGSPSRDTLVNRLKRATMGLTLAQEDRSFAPQPNHTNLKKYADWVGVRLQNTIDPSTGKPRLKSIAKPAGTKAPRLAAGQTYWLIGSTNDAQHPAVIGDHTDLDALKVVAQRRQREFTAFWFIIAPEPEPLDIGTEPEIAELHQNTAVFTAAVDFERA